MGTRAKIGVGLIIAIIGFLIFAVNGAYTHYVNAIGYETKIGDYFDQSDLATTPQKKLEFWDKYMSGIRSEGLDKGVNSVYNTAKPLANNTLNYELAGDIREKLVRWSEIDQIENPGGYKIIQEEVTWQDYCWYPKHSFYQAYQLNHGGWGAAMFPPDQYDFCSGQRPADTVKVTTPTK